MSTERRGQVYRQRQDDKPKLSAVEKRAQATLMMMERLFGGPSGTLKALGEKYHMDPRTVQRRLALARQDGVPDEAREVFIREMLPQSMAVLQEALTGTDLRLAVTVALKIVDGLKAMDAPAAAAVATGMEETLESWKAELTVRRTRAATDDPHPGGRAEAGTRIFDGEWISQPVEPDTGHPLDIHYPPATASETAPDSPAGLAPVRVLPRPSDDGADAESETPPAAPVAGSGESGV